MGTTYFPDIVLGAKNTMMKAADESPSFMERNSKDREEVDRVGGQRRLEKSMFDQRSIEVRKLTMAISGERAFKAEEETSAKILKHLHIQRRR